MFNHVFAEDVEKAVGWHGEGQPSVQKNRAGREGIERRIQPSIQQVGTAADLQPGRRRMRQVCRHFAGRDPGPILLTHAENQAGHRWNCPGIGPVLHCGEYMAAAGRGKAIL